MALGEISTGEDYFEATNGLKIPTPESYANYTGENEFLLFFRNLWEANGFDVSTNSYNGLRHIPRPFEHELVIPNESAHQYTILRGSFKARDIDSIEADLTSNKAREEWGNWRAAEVGHEQHGIYVPPAQIGSMLPLVEVRYTHTTGGSGYQGTTGISIFKLGERITEYDFENRELMAAGTWQEERKRTEEVYNEAIRTLISETVQLIQG
jgi:hypothetical protein